MTENNTTVRGFALLMTLVVVSVVLAIGLSLVQLSLQQLTLSVDARDSELAFHATSAGLECGIHSRNANPATFIDWDDTESDPVIDCMEVDNVNPITATRDNSPATGYVNQFQYELEPNFGTRGNACIEIDMFVIHAESGPIDDYPVGGGLGLLDCASGSICTAVLARGYNKADCSAAAVGPYEIMRELNAVF